MASNDSMDDFVAQMKANPIDLRNYLSEEELKKMSDTEKRVKCNLAENSLLCVHLGQLCHFKNPCVNSPRFLFDRHDSPSSQLDDEEEDPPT